MFHLWHSWNTWTYTHDGTTKIQNTGRLRTCRGCGERQEVSLVCPPHRWTEWTIGEKIDIYDDSNGQSRFPIRSDLRQVRRCILCKMEDVRRTDRY